MLDMLNRDSIDVLLEAVNAANPGLKIKLDKTNVTVGDVREINENGMDAEVDIVAKANGPFKGALTFQYSRADINTAYGRNIQLDMTDLAEVGKDYATGILAAPGADTLPLSEEFKVNIATASEEFTAKPLPAYSPAASNSHIWKPTAPKVSIRTRILPPPAPQEMITIAYKNITGLDSISLGPDTVHSIDGGYVDSFYHHGKIYSVNVKTAEATSITPTLNGAAVTGTRIHLTETMAPVLISDDDKKVYYFGNIFPDPVVTELTTTSDITNVDFSQFTIPLYDSNNEYSVILSNKGNLLLDLGLAHNGTYLVSEVSGPALGANEKLLPETITTDDMGLFVISSNEYKVYGITPFDANTIELKFDYSAHASRAVSMSLHNDILYIGGVDGLYIKQPIAGGEPDIKQITIGSSFYIYAFDHVNDRLNCTINKNGTIMFEVYKLSDGSFVETKTPTFYPTIKYFNTSSRGLSQFGLNVFHGTNVLVQVDYSLDHELTANA